MLVINYIMPRRKRAPSLPSSTPKSASQSSSTLSSASSQPILSAIPIDKTSGRCPKQKLLASKLDNRDSEQIYDVEKILDKKLFDGKLYYLIKWVGYDKPTWEIAKNCLCTDLIKAFEKSIKSGTHASSVQPDEWEVEEVLDKRVCDGKVEYLVKWRGWAGSPTWELAENCNCYNLIAAFENPKLRRLWNFRGSNTKLWLDHETILGFMRKQTKSLDRNINLLTFLPDYPQEESYVELLDGVNMGPLRYENHWYLVIILQNVMGVTRHILIGDSLNTMIGVKFREHPVYKRLRRVYSNFVIKPVSMTQMDRSDMCAFYLLAAFERALFLFDKRANFIVENIYFEPSRAELIRSYLRPDTNGQICVSLPVPIEYFEGPACEFCGKLYDKVSRVDEHIMRRHMAGTNKPPRTKHKIECIQIDDDDDGMADIEVTSSTQEDERKRKSR